MKYFDQKIKKNKYILLMAVIQVALMLILVFTNSIKYDTGDDYVFVQTAGGMYGDYSPYIVFGNIVYGKILALLYEYFGVVNWLPVIYLSAACLSYILIGIVLIKKKGNIIGSVLTYSLLLVSFSQIYVLLNFTRISAIVCFGGWLCLLYCLGKKKIEYKILAILSGILIVLGSMIRFEVFLLASAFAFCVFIYELICVRENGRLSVNKSKAVKYSCICGGIIVISFFLQMLNSYVYQSSAEWKEYSEYNVLRADLMDFGMIDYNESKEAYEEIGVSYVDYSTLKIWIFADTDVYSKEVLQKIVDLKPERTFGIKNVIEFLSVYLKTHMVTALCGYGILLLILCFPCIDKKTKILLLGCIIIVLLEFGYMYYVGRTVARVVMIPLLGMSITLAYGLERKLSKGAIFTLMVYTVLVGDVLSIQYNANNEITRANTISFLESTVEDEEFYLFDVHDAIKITRPFKMFDIPQKDLLTSISYTGGWNVPIPYLVDNLEKNGIENPMESLAKDSKVMLVGDSFIDLKLEFMREHYDKELEYSLFKKTYGFDIYAFSSNIHEWMSDTSGSFFEIEDFSIYAQEKAIWSVTGTITEDDNASESDTEYYLQVYNETDGVCSTYRVENINGEFSVGIHSTSLNAGDKIEVSMLKKNKEIYYKLTEAERIIL